MKSYWFDTFLTETAVNPNCISIKVKLDNDIDSLFAKSFLRRYFTTELEMANKPSSVEFADTISDLMNGTAGWLLIGLGTAAFLSGLGGIAQYAGTADTMIPVLVLLFSFIFITSGMLVNPRFRRRLDRRYEVSRFGRVQSVDSRVLSESENRVEPCTSCDAKMREGLVRRYREEYIAAGIPIWTLSENHNFYCSTCATEELPGLTLIDRDDDSTTEQVVTEVE